MFDECPPTTECTPMLTSIRLINFKCYADSGKINLAPLTVIVGCNNAGKSSLFQPILALKQTIWDRSYNARLVTSGDFVELGGFSDFTNKSRGARSSGDVTFEFEREPLDMPVKGKQATGLSLTFGHNRPANRIQLRTQSYFDAHGKIGNFHEISQPGSLDCKIHWDYYNIPASDKKRIGVHFHNFLPAMDINFGSLSQKQRIKIFARFIPAEMQASPWEALFARVQHIAPLRHKIPWYTRRGIQVSSGVPGALGENLIRLMESKETVGGTKKTLRARLNDWIVGRRLGSAVREKRPFLGISNLRAAKISGNFISLLADEVGGARSINVAAMGEGVSQILPIIATCLRSTRGQCLVIEQPEIHLHPAAQAELGDLFVEIAREKQRQLIIETHSEHLLTRIRRHVANGEIDASSVAILFVEKKDGESRVRRIKLNGNGHFAEWPDGFFDTAYQEALALSQAAPQIRRPAN